MKGRVIILDAPEDRISAAALVVDGRLEDLMLDPPKGTVLPSSGDICVVRVKRKLPKAGAFCEMANGQQAYLRDSKSVREGERLLVQVVSLPEPGKAVTLTTRLLFKGPRLILTPGAPGVNVSRRIGNASERERLEQAVSTALAGEVTDTGTTGVIVRSNAKTEDPRDLQNELGLLYAKWRRAQEFFTRNDGNRGTGESAAFQIALRDWLFPLPDAILCAESLRTALLGRDDDMGFVNLWGDERVPLLIHSEPAPFKSSGIHDDIQELRSADVSLGNGASMTVEATTALVAVDVNTGADFSPAAGLKANLAAARDLPRQLRLRGLGGQIVVDFAPIPKQHRRALEEALKKAFSDDAIETSLVGWTGLGLYELQRKRERRPLTEVLL
jgi:ribonuclease G